MTDHPGPMPPGMPEPTERRPRLPLDNLIDMGVHMDGDYCDGDCSGYHHAHFENGVLTLTYTDDPFSQNAEARAQFVEVGALIEALLKDLNEPNSLKATWRDLLSEALGTEVYPYEPEGT